MACSAQTVATKELQLRPLETFRPVMLDTARRTAFDPAVHGFRFANTFQNDFISELDVRTNGLCGGMVYTTLDFFHAGRAIPRQGHRPAVQTRLHDYIYDRQVHSIERNVDKWMEVGFNPLGARDSEFFNWGLQGFGGGRLQELRAEIDSGRPVPLGLQQYDGNGPKNHQVLAIGYDLGRYKGDLGDYKEDLRIFVYDPNHVGQTLTLVPDTKRQAFHYLERTDRVWRTYFVDRNYSARTPPALSERSSSSDGIIEALLIEFHTGGDDLRGGNDNVNVTIFLRGSAPQTMANVNRGRRWIGNYTQTVRIPLRRRVRIEDIESVRIDTTFGGGIGGDNWNLDQMRIIAEDGAAQHQLFDRTGTPLMRFTGERKTYLARLR
ncbi:hypothetical protein HFP89_01480 [Wenzhouxiangella sp. XN79A]|uniref:hypothetical protein n=1 Tax=Wenzhouxiangella sp. XN79A TaxID=2724193 RepID=UPI00144AC27E|nr:hypothetical protein [Wenzhouxiangella sp. XN79A]NKI33834.1 hypothetical protein [Wenzhouxiangella sp. XN79A]